jgi:two-component system, OmpR family, phosphate regulon sensor histidine kinase PhoR
MIRLRPRSLFGQLSLALIALQVVGITALTWAAVAEVQRIARDQARAAAGHIVTDVAVAYEALYDPADLSALRARIEADSRAHQLRFTVLDGSARTLVDSSLGGEDLGGSLSQPEVDAALQTGVGSDLRHNPRLEHRTLFYASRLDLAGEPGVLRLAYPLTRAGREISALIRTMVIAGAVSLLLTLFCVGVIARFHASVVARLERSAHRFADGDLEHQIIQPTTAELVGLSLALNRMALSLHQAMEERQAKQAELQAILQSMGTGVLALDLEQRILDVNRAGERLLGLEAAPSRRRLLQEVLREPSLHRYVDDAMHGKATRQAEFTLDREEPLIVQATYQTLRDAGDTPVGLLLLLDDVTQLRHLERLRSDFGAAVSHELRTPITNIQGYVETLLDVGLDKPGQTRRFLEIIRNNSHRLKAIVEDTLALARLEEPRTRDSVERQEVSVQALVAGAIGQYSAAAARQDIQIQCNVPTGLTVAGQAQMLEQALSNLLSNAIAYSPAGTTVRVAAKPGTNWSVELSVADEGVGIAAEHLPRLFERFYRVDKARSRNAGGTGLGLAIVKHIVNVHGGRVEVESTLGKGTVFRLVLPGEGG